ncbi:unnamed protein product [Owenia fusiformis]|uniref:Uncharacterized protein n=1 Tax=Owenia fusiformis TaxID=6347 RepID=A0A8J1U0U0_OWEFU|nr:unnamed protein product [Owenia fusiformis]
MWRKSNAMFFMTIIFTIVSKAPVSSLSTNQQTTTEKQDWIFPCGKSKIPCDKINNFCEERMDKCIPCLEYCSEARIKGHENYQTQCRENCPVFMRDKENKRTRKLNNPTGSSLEAKASTGDPLTITAKTESDVEHKEQQNDLKIPLSIIVSILGLAIIGIGIVIWKHHKTKRPKQCENNVETGARDPLMTDKNKLIRTAGSSVPSQTCGCFSECQHKCGNSDIANQNDFEAETELKAENNDLVIGNQSC